MKISKNNEVRIKLADNGVVIQSFELDTDEKGEPWTKEYLNVVAGEPDGTFGDRKEYVDFMVEMLEEIADQLGYLYQKHKEWNLEIKREKNPDYGAE